mmetsp:Transcript_4919/g.9502  ORF Transcript_4919/g.9502 Transcript_4919/m.9502 type:complete len:1390 (-) Transcript_4919:208-4377(-)
MKELFAVGKEEHGRGSVTVKWDPLCKYLATCGKNRRVHIYARNGDLLDEFALQGNCLQIEWDKDGETVAVLQEGNNQIPLWHVNERKVKNLQTNLKADPTFMCWSKSGPQLAIGSAKGNLLIYNSRSQKKYPCIGKHSKRITCGMWNKDNLLALGSDDKTVTINDEGGEELQRTTTLKGEPSALQFNTQKVDGSKSTEQSVSVIMGKDGQTILLYNLADPDHPFELDFQAKAKYGDIVCYSWFGDGYLMIAFSRGFVVLISTHLKEIGKEQNSIKLHEGALYHAVFSNAVGKFATCGQGGVKVVDVTDWTESKTDTCNFSREQGEPEALEWTADGQILTVSTTTGFVFNYLMSIPVVSARNADSLLYLSSLRHVSVCKCHEGSTTEEATLEIDVEPSFMAIGPDMLAVGMNNHVWFYNYTPRDTSLVTEKEYLGSVSQIALNGLYVGVLSRGKVHLNCIHPEQVEHEDREEHTFPSDEDDEPNITSLAMTQDFLVYSTSAGTIHHFYLKDWGFVNEFRHDFGISRVFPNPIGTREVFVDTQGKAFLHSPVDDHKKDVPYFPQACSDVMWDPADMSVFVALDSVRKQAVTYTYSSQTIKGSHVQKVASTPLPSGFRPCLLNQGTLFGQNASGDLAQVTLLSHEAVLYTGRKTVEKQRQTLTQQLQLHQLNDAWEMALELNQPDTWQSLGRKALEQLDVNMAIRVYREMRDTAMVLALQKLVHVEDKHLLAGHICLLNQDYHKAQALFLSSSSPIAALHMRRDLLDWDQALKLANNLAEDQIPIICREYAQQLEVKGEYAQALELYDQALSQRVAPELEKDHTRIANAGVARMTLRMGDLNKGRRLAMESLDKHLMQECAAILEQMKQYSDAAEMYVEAECFEKAAAIFIMTKNFRKATPLMDRITTPKLHAQYAKAKEAEKDYAAAAVAYEKAKDMDSVIRLMLKFLDNPSRAFAIVRKTRSSEGAAMVAQYCTDTGDYQAAIEFLLMAKRSDEAFQLAQGHNEMSKYAAALGDDGARDEYLRIAVYYESKEDWGNAGKFYAICNDHSKAIALFLQCGEDKIDEAIEVVKKSQGTPDAEMYVHTVHDFLIGESDGKVKDLKYIFRLFMAIGEYSQAANTAILIAAQEQKDGNYQVAHNMLFETYQDLDAQKIDIPQELSKNLLLLHSYTLVKRLVKVKDHQSAARMLIRVAKSISKFPNHIVQILTSTVIECQRAGLKKSSFEYASMLMRAEYRNSVDPRYKKKIGGIVRRPDNIEEGEAHSPCPFCKFDMPETLLDCPSCLNSVPYCVTTGRHMVRDDWTMCPNCRFPSLYSAFVPWIKENGHCCMCRQAVTLESIVKVTDVDAILHKGDEEKKEDEEKEEKKPKKDEEDGAIKVNPADAPFQPKKANW